MAFESFDGLADPRREYGPEQLRASELGNRLVLDGHASVEELDKLLGWATHPDCPEDQRQQIIDLFEARLAATPPEA